MGRLLTVHIKKHAAARAPADRRDFILDQKGNEASEKFDVEEKMIESVLTD